MISETREKDISPENKFLLSSKTEIRVELFDTDENFLQLKKYYYQTFLMETVISINIFGELLQAFNFYSTGLLVLTLG